MISKLQIAALFFIFTSALWFYSSVQNNNQAVEIYQLNVKLIGMSGENSQMQAQHKQDLFNLTRCYETHVFVEK